MNDEHDICADCGELRHRHRPGKIIFHDFLEPCRDGQHSYREGPTQNHAVWCTCGGEFAQVVRILTRP